MINGFLGLIIFFSQRDKIFILSILRMIILWGKNIALFCWPWNNQNTCFFPLFGIFRSFSLGSCNSLNCSSLSALFITTILPNCREVYNRGSFSFTLKMKLFSSRRAPEVRDAVLFSFSLDPSKLEQPLLTHSYRWPEGVEQWSTVMAAAQGTWQSPQLPGFQPPPGFQQQHQGLSSNDMIGF